jgi:pimeloyl-ACP methyl ester carboxylesterase
VHEREDFDVTCERQHGPGRLAEHDFGDCVRIDLDSPVWRHWVGFFAEHFRFIRYDERGCGLSEWDVNRVEGGDERRDLETIIEVARPAKPFVLLGISQGAAEALRYAANHPADISHLILSGAYAQGRFRRGDPEVEQPTAR